MIRGASTILLAALALARPCAAQRALVRVPAGDLAPISSLGGIGSASLSSSLGPTPGLTGLGPSLELTGLTLGAGLSPALGSSLGTPLAASPFSPSPLTAPAAQLSSRESLRAASSALAQDPEAARTHPFAAHLASDAAFPGSSAGLESSGSYAEDSFLHRANLGPRSKLVPPSTVLADPPRKPDFDSNRFVTVELGPRLLTRRGRKVLAELERKGFKQVSEYERGRPVLGEADLHQVRALSRVPGVASIQRTSGEYRTVWKKGEYAGRSEALFTVEGDREKYNEMAEPVRGLPKHDLASIRKAAKSGVTIVTVHSRPSTPEEVAEMERLYGARLFFSEDIPIDSPMIRLPGLVLHIGADAHGLVVRGDLTLTIGHGRLLGSLDKATEATWVRGVDPRYMAPSMTARTLLKKRDRGKFEARRREVKKKLEAFLAAEDGTGYYALRDDFAALLKEFLVLAEKEFKKGAFLKWANDYASMEAESIITTFSTDPTAVADYYLDFLSAAKGEIETPRLGAVELDDESAEVAVAHALMTKPADILVQERLDVLKTETGSNVEFRVDAWAGHAVNSAFRYGTDFYPEEAKGARRFVQRFLDRLSARDGWFSGGFDVVKVRPTPKKKQTRGYSGGDIGDFRIIETNPGTDSSMADSRAYPIDANVALSYLLGRPTPLIRRLETLYASPVEHQAKFLKRRRQETDEKGAFKDIPVYEILLWLRERAIADWNEHGGRARHAREILLHFKRLARLAEKSEYWDFIDVRASMRNYFKRKGVRL
ncbi:MAG: hypothetical protein HY078_06655 [Elusimicrobia bacterium]|nr:hypothetical protein [Elusimicrobiota bacterium]